MHKHIKPILALATAAALLLAACGGGKADQKDKPLQPEAKGRYVEKDITPAEGQNSLTSFRTPEGKLISYDEGWKTRYESSDEGESWQQSPGPGAEDERFADVWVSTLLSDGSILAEVHGDEGSELMRVTEDGRSEPYALAEYDDLKQEGKAPNVTLLEGMPDGRLLYSISYDDASSDRFGAIAPPEEAAEEGAEGGAENAAAEANPEEAPQSGENEAAPGQAEDAPDSEADESEDSSAAFSGGYGSLTSLVDTATGKILAELGEEMPLAAAADGENAYLLGYDGAVTARSLASGKPVDSVKGSYELDGLNFYVRMGAQAGKVWFAGTKGVYRLDTATGEYTPLLGGTEYSFGAQGAQMKSLLLLGEDKLVMGVDAEGDARLLRYHYDPEAELDPAKTLKLWALEDNPVVRAVVDRFRQSHPEVTVQLEIATSESGGLTAQDAVNELNTRLLAGEGPDLLLLDGTPMESYAARGVLADLGAVAEGAGMYPKVLEAFSGQEGTYMLPTRMKVPVLLGAGKEKLAELSSFEDVVKAMLADKEPTAPKNSDDQFSTLPEAERSSFVFSDFDELFDLWWNSSANAVLAGGEVKEDALRTFLDTLKQAADHYHVTNENMSAGAMGLGMSDGSVVMLQGGPVAYSMGRSNYTGFTLEDMQVLLMMSEAPGTEAGVFPGLGGGSWVPAGILGVNADSPNLELATAFVAEALGTEVQGLRIGGGLPVTAAGYEAQLAAVQKFQAEIQTNLEGVENVKIDFSSVIEGLGAPVLADSYTRETVMEAARKLVEGELELDAAVAEVRGLMANYLAERQ